MKAAGKGVALLGALLLVIGLIGASTTPATAAQSPLSPYIGQCVSVFIDNQTAVAGTLVTVADSYIQLDVQNQNPSALIRTTLFVNRIAVFIPFCL